jgi:hypothetical protein
MAQGAAQHAHVGVRPKGASEKPGGMQALQPLAIEPIRCRSAGDALGLAGVDRGPPQAVFRQKFLQSYRKARWPITRSAPNCGPRGGRTGPPGPRPDAGGR